MHIIEVAFDMCGFDDRLAAPTAISNYVWNLSRGFARRGHRVSVVTPVYGQLADIRSRYDVTTLPDIDEYRFDVPFGPSAGRDTGDWATVAARTTAHVLRQDGVDICLLSHDIGECTGIAGHPRAESIAHLVAQLGVVRFIRNRFGDGRAIVHLHDPSRHYLMPAALRTSTGKHVVSTVHTSTITSMVYRPEVDALLGFLQAARHESPPRRASPADPATTWYRAMSHYQRRVRLHQEYPPGYVGVFELVAEHADLIGFVSPGQEWFTATFADTPFEQFARHLDIATTIRATAHKRFVAGHGLSPRWLVGDPDRVSRSQVLGAVGLDPELTTFYYHGSGTGNGDLTDPGDLTGQHDLARAIDAVLGAGVAVNFLIHGLAAPPTESDTAESPLHSLSRRYPDRVRVASPPVDSDQLYAEAASSDFCVFPAKCEPDAVPSTLGEAMAAGLVPIATAQAGTAHFGHVADPLDGASADTATGFAIRRSLRDHDPLLVADLIEVIQQADLLRRQRPEMYELLSSRAAATARGFTWDRCVDDHLTALEPLHRGDRPQLRVADALRNGWFELLDSDSWRLHAREIADRAEQLGDIDAYAKVAPLTPLACERLFEAAYHKADFASCARIAERSAQSAVLRGLGAIRERCHLTITPAGSGVEASWRLRYRLPHVRKVELVLCRAGETSDDHATVITLTGGAEGFAASLPGEPPDQLPLLLTLDSGRVTWDIVERRRSRG